DAADAVRGTVAIAEILAIAPRTLRLWRAENHLGLADVVQQASARGRLFASRRRLGEVRAAMQAQQAASVSPRSRRRTVAATGARAMILGAIQRAGRPLTAAEITRRCRGIDVTKSLRPELVRL